MLKLFALIMALLCLSIAPAVGQDANPVTCDELATIYHAELVPVNYDLPHGWDWVIDDMEKVAKVYLGNGATLEQWREAPARQLWLFHFFDHVATEVNGNLGLHNICVFRIPIGQR